MLTPYPWVYESLWSHHITDFLDVEFNLNDILNAVQKTKRKYYVYQQKLKKFKKHNKTNTKFN